jgi:hypothetical protein
MYGSEAITTAVLRHVAFLEKADDPLLPHPRWKCINATCSLHHGELECYADAAEGSVEAICRAVHGPQLDREATAILAERWADALDTVGEHALSGEIVDPEDIMGAHDQRHARKRVRPQRYPIGNGEISTVTKKLKLEQHLAPSR